MGREGLEPSKLKLSHFERDAFTNFAIYPIIQTLLYYNHQFIAIFYLNK